MQPVPSQLFCITSTVTWLLRMQYCVVDPTMNLTSRPLSCAAMMMATARSSSAFSQIICPTLSASSAPRRMLTWYGTCTSIRLACKYRCKCSQVEPRGCLIHDCSTAA